ncbi:hypothetical protein Tco_0584285 [Tanacetum coccineum]
MRLAGLNTMLGSKVVKKSKRIGCNGNKSLHYYTVSSTQAAESIEEKHKRLRFTKATSKVAENNGGVGEGRRLLLLSTVVAATDSKTRLLQTKVELLAYNSLRREDKVDRQPSSKWV